MIEEYFASVSGEDDWNPRYNIAPTQSVPVIRQNPKEPRRELSLLRWGLIPSWSWAGDPSVAAQMINARSETAATKPAFRRGAPASLLFYEIRTAFAVGDKIA
jgi:putative SOS response-associated peptidase YedK